MDFFVKHYIQTPIKTSLKFFEEKTIIFSNISKLRLGKNTSIAMQNITESSKKNQLTMTNQSKMFSIRLENYNNT